MRIFNLAYNLALMICVIIMIYAIAVSFRQSGVTDEEYMRERDRQIQLDKEFYRRNPEAWERLHERMLDSGWNPASQHHK
jgi:uncharacterized membrane protein